MASELPKLIVIKSKLSGRYLKYLTTPKVEKGFVTNTEPYIFEPMCKIEVVKAKIDSRYVNLRFSHSNKYLARESGGTRVFASSVKPEEDTTKEACTLFDPFQEQDGNYLFKHVQSGGTMTSPSGNEGEEHVFIDDYAGSGLYMEISFGVLDWETIALLPKYVALKGDNDRFLIETEDGHLKYSSKDGNEDSAGFEVTMTPDGYARFKSNRYGYFWRHHPFDNDFVKVDSSDTSNSNRDTLFWPMLINDNIITLRSAGNNRFCKRLTSGGKTDYLSAVETSMTEGSRMRVEELVLDRKITDVTFVLENARIYDEVPILAGRASAVNESNVEANMTARVAYEDEQSYTFNNSLSVKVGIKTTFEIGIPFISKGSIEVSAEAGTEIGWGSAVLKRRSIEATYTANIPARSVITVDYVATKGKCDVPFSYTQRDRLSHDGRFVSSQHVDGVFNGINAYDFYFTEHQINPL